MELDLDEDDLSYVQTLAQMSADLACNDRRHPGPIVRTTDPMENTRELYERFGPFSLSFPGLDDSPEWYEGGPNYWDDDGPGVEA